MERARDLYRYPQKGSDAYPLALVVPSPLTAVADNLGFQEVYHALQTEETLSVTPLFERNGALADKDGAAFQHPLNIAFASISYELDFLPFLKLYDAYLRAARVFAGGFAVSSAPSFLEGIAEGVFAGDLDALPERWTSDVAHAIRTNAPLPHFKPPSSAVTPRAPHAPLIPARTRTLYRESHFNAFSIEINRGCPFHCRFCEIPSLKALRFASYESVLDALKEIPPDIRRVALIGTAIASHPELLRIVHAVKAEGYEVSFSSLRADIVADETLSLLAETGTRTLTVAPEAGSERLKRAIAKSVTKDRLVSIVDAAMERGVSRFKLYYIIGIPGETLDDVLAIADEARAIVDYAKRKAKTRKRMPIISLSANPYIVKRANYTGVETFISERAWNERTTALRSALLSVGGARVAFHSYREALCESMISFADGDVAQKIVREKLYDMPLKRLTKTLLKTYTTPVFAEVDA